MNTRKLGATDLDLSPIAFGAWAIGGWAWGGTDDEAAIAALRTALDVGMFAIDTAPIYGFGHSEEVVGRALAGRRSEAVVMTKVGFRWDDPGGEVGFDSAGPDGRRISIRRNSRPASIRTEVDRSLARLGVERIDLVQVHTRDKSTPIDETMGALVELRQAGKLREIGVSNYSLDELEEARRALGQVPLASDQPKYSLVAREIEADILPWARDRGVGVLVYSPLEQGLLTGKVDAARRFPPADGRNKRPTFRASNRAAVGALLEAVVLPIAREHDASLAQVVLAWTIQQPGVTAALVGARRPEQVRENFAAASLRLDEHELSTIGRAFDALELDLRPHKPGLVERVRARVGGLLSRPR